MTDLQVHPGWWRTDSDLLDRVRSLYVYGPNDDRATGIIYGEGNTWPESLREVGPELLAQLKGLTGIDYEIVAFQAYLDGSSCGWHQDSPFDAQAILSLGTTRTFAIRPVGTEDAEFFSLQHGDLVIMPSGFQNLWQHSVPTEEVTGERCSLVFRTVLRE